MKSFKSNIILFLILTFYHSFSLSQAIPTTFHFSPPTSNFQALRVVGSFNGWNNADNNYQMFDYDGDGEYHLTTPLAQGVTHNYKFVIDADWGQAFTDPDNPLINTSDNNNSIINITDPMITYLLPRAETSSGNMFIDTTSLGLPIRVIINHSSSNSIDLSSLTLSIDGELIESPEQYFNSELHELLFQPSTPPSEGEHNIAVSITSDAGTITSTSTYRYEPNLIIVTKPTLFYFDMNSSRHSFMQSINSVSLMGDFNNWNNQLNPMTDVNSDGVWETSMDLEENIWNYKFQLNGSFWTVDWDNPNFNPDNPNNNIIEVIPDSLPYISVISPLQGSIFNESISDINLQAILTPGVFGDGVNESTIQITHNGSNLNFQFDSINFELSSLVNINESGYHHIEISFINGVGISTSTEFTFGNYAEDSGFHFVDAKNDLKYSNLESIDTEALDIKSFHLSPSNDFNKLNVMIEMENIHDRTRLGLLISNPVSSFAEDPRSLDIMLPDWNNEGIFISIAHPSSSILNTNTENRIQVSRDPILYDDIVIELNAEALINNQFDFEIELMLLDSLLGGWNQERNFILFSYIAKEDGTGDGYEISENEGGINTYEDPDIYDALFIHDAFWQNRILSNYFPIDHPYGPMLSGLDGIGRGIGTITADEISDSLASFGPVITFLTPGESYWYNELTIFGTIDDFEISTVTFFFNNQDSIIEVNNGQFSLDVLLLEGENSAFVQAIGSDGFEALSRELVLTYEIDNTPSVTIESIVNESSITLDAIGNSPYNSDFTYYWTVDSDNPSSLSFQGPPHLPTLVVNQPEVYGEYYINILARDDENRTTTARRRMILDESGFNISTIDEHADWIDHAIFYEIYPRSFTTQGGFNGILSRIPDMVDLGINAIWLMPIYKGPTLHGYEITDYFDFEDDFGTAVEFQHLVNELHENNIRIILDFVVNHTSIQHRFMQNVFEYNQYSPWSNFYIWDGLAGDSNYEYFFDWASLPNLNHNNIDVRNYFIDVAKYWVNEFDIDGYRCDVAWGVEQRNPEFWQDWRNALKNIKPEVFLEAEASSTDSVYFENRFDSANDWNLRNKIISTINGIIPIDDLNNEILRSYPNNALPFRFLENHDEVRLASYLDTERSKLAHTIIMTTNGVPLIYSGGEVGEMTTRELINWSDPDELRPYFKRVIEIRKQYIYKPIIQRLPNTKPNEIYTYASLSENHILITAANFNSESSEFQLDLLSLPFEGDNSYYLTNLIDGSVIEILPNESDSISLVLNPYEATIFYYSSNTLSIENDENDIIDFAFHLSQNYPNPFNPTTSIEFEIPLEIDVMINFYNILGQKIASLDQGFIKPGNYKTIWNGKDSKGRIVPSGIYFYEIKAGNQFHKIKKLTLLK